MSLVNHFSNPEAGRLFGSLGPAQLAGGPGPNLVALGQEEAEPLTVRRRYCGWTWWLAEVDTVGCTWKVCCIDTVA